MPKTDTNALTKSVIDWLRWKGILAWRNNNGAVFDPKRGIHRKPPPGALKGVPDILGILPDGTFLGVEIKTGKDKLSPEQNDFLNQAIIRGAVAFEARTLECVQQRVDNFLRSQTTAYLIPDRIGEAHGWS